MQNKNKSYTLNLEQIKTIINNSETEVVSFDIFDTLLMRPSMEPRDIFYLLQKEVKDSYGIDFVAIRMSAEEELGQENATINDIWNFIRYKYDLSSEITRILMEKEIELEKRLLMRRKEIYDLYCYAISKSKRVIATSDMYLPAEILQKILISKGYNDISHIYVSCEMKARKSSGALYDEVIQKENIQTFSGMIHIGDNYFSDYQVPLKKGILAIYYPSVWNQIFSAGSWWCELRENGLFSQDPAIRLLYSFIFMQNEAECVQALQKNKQRIPSLKMFTHLVIMPMLISVALAIQNTPEIAENYDMVQFAARDGYLPKEVYDLIAAKQLSVLPSEYLLVSRRALSFAEYDDFFDYFEAEGTMDVPYTLGQYIRHILIDKDLVQKIYKQLSGKERGIDLHVASDRAKKTLLRFKKALNQYFKQQREWALEYYRDGKFEQGKKYLVFDCGYSGSVARGLKKAFPDAIFDKYYLWQTDKNRLSDKKDNTKTYCMSLRDVPFGFNIICEECFSPVQGSCVGFCHGNTCVEPILEKTQYDDSMQQDLNIIKSECLGGVKAFLDIFGDYLNGFSFEDKDVFERIYTKAFLEAPYTNFKIFGNIRFEDAYARQGSDTLEQKVVQCYESLGRYNHDPIKETAFADPWKYITPAQIRPAAPKIPPLKIGIHIHMYYIHLYNELTAYLKDFPVPFDLIVTVGNNGAKNVIERVFTKELLPNLKKCVVLVVPNRGRDVAPWLIATRQYQSSYDLFCHIHAKESYQYGEGHGDGWRRYLYDNLIERNAAADILTLFAENGSIGCLFPRIYQLMFDIHRNNNIPLAGDYDESKMIVALLKKMSLPADFSREDLLFSVGTMLWYRPAALMPLFDLNLSYEDFPPEPLPVGGTIAHAIERMPAIVAQKKGYETLIFNEKETGPLYMSSREEAPQVTSDHPFGVRGALGIFFRKKLPASAAEKLVRMFHLE